MAARTYLPMLLRILKRVCDYLVRYRDQIVENLPEGSASKIDAVVTACNILRDVIPVDVPTE